ncbi:cell division control protein 1-like isoform X2 [Pomacea canaliculata]|uniref:cell division control protein 1-like isoform X2 n=1 Tax=Pomacea canaliculata TaxID=400727 RepID=UPI000D736723|nr:cell division control protein 1-like isoform X2 [Pomacea canaliculata]
MRLQLRVKDNDCMAMIWVKKHMWFRWIRNFSPRSLLLLYVLLVIVVNEYLVFWVQSWRWPSLPDHSRNPEEELVILLASDPQLIGIQDEHGFPLGSITRWDSDRFLSKTFALAYNYLQPDVVVFLGDLMDEGSKATQEEYKSYVERFHSVFYLMKGSKVIYVPGDNDIGGEGGDVRTPGKIRRFESHFENTTGVVKVHFLDFIKLNWQVYHSSPVQMKSIIKGMVQQMTSPIRIVLNHEPVIVQMKNMVYPVRGNCQSCLYIALVLWIIVLKMAQPSLLFVGHWHASQLYTCDTCLSSNEDSSHWPVHVQDLQQFKGFVTVDFTNLISVHEVMIPTCSYRMGTSSMGYGVAFIKKSGSMKYGVLWLPSRYYQLYAYLAALGALPFIACLLEVVIFLRSFSRQRWT